MPLVGPLSFASDSPLPLGNAALRAAIQQLTMAPQGGYPTEPAPLLMPPTQGGAGSMSTEGVSKKEPMGAMGNPALVGGDDLESNVLASRRAAEHLAAAGPSPVGAAGSGGGGGGTGQGAICSEMYRQGYMSEEMWRADQRFYVPADVLRGYHRFAYTIVGAMKRSRLVAWLVSIPGMAWAREMAHREGVLPQGSLVGAIILAVGVPVCRWLGQR